jgi:hypothetical protein
MSLARIQGSPAEAVIPEENQVTRTVRPTAVPPQSPAPPPTTRPTVSAPAPAPPQSAGTRSPLAPMTRLSDLNKKPVAMETADTDPESAETSENQVEPVILTSTLLKTYWMEFAEQLHDDQPRLYSTLTTQMPDLSEDNKIILNLNNPLQEKAIRSIQTELLQFLRKRSGHSELEMQTAVPEEQNSEKKLYTQEEKYQHLQKKNPDLDLFRQSLNLELE